MIWLSSLFSWLITVKFIASCPKIMIFILSSANVYVISS